MNDEYESTYDIRDVMELDDDQLEEFQQTTFGGVMDWTQEEREEFFGHEEYDDDSDAPDTDDIMDELEDGG